MSDTRDQMSRRELEPSVPVAPGRRTGWTEGPMIILARGSTWHLPAIDDGLIPILPRVIQLARSVALDLDCSHRLRSARPDGAERRFLRLMTALLQAQYKAAKPGLTTLILGTEVLDLIAVLNVLDRYLKDLLTFATHRLPAAASVATHRN